MVPKRSDSEDEGDMVLRNSGGAIPLISSVSGRGRRSILFRKTSLIHFPEAGPGARCNLRSHHGVIRQPGSRRDRDSQLSLAPLPGGGEPKFDDLEKRLTAAPVITVPTITLEGDANGAPHPDPRVYAAKFSGKYAHRLITGGVGHNLPQEAPKAFSDAVVEVDGY